MQAIARRFASLSSVCFTLAVCSNLILTACIPVSVVTPAVWRSADDFGEIMADHADKAKGQGQSPLNFSDLATISGSTIASGLGLYCCRWSRNARQTRLLLTVMSTESEMNLGSLNRELSSTPEEQ